MDVIRHENQDPDKYIYAIFDDFSIKNFHQKYNSPPSLIFSSLKEFINDKIPECAIFLFNDIECLADEKIQLDINKIKEIILCTGRYRDIKIVATSQLNNTNERNASRTLLNKMSTLTIYPNSGSLYQIEYVLKYYFGLSSRQIK